METKRGLGMFLIKKNPGDRFTLKDFFVQFEKVSAGISFRGGGVGPI